jgi:hypothetical protein
LNAVLGGKIVAGWTCNTYSMPMVHVHQREYSEIEAEGRTLVEACGCLIGLLVQAIDLASEAWRRQPLRLALVDARAFNGSFVTIAWIEPRLSHRCSM